MVALLQCGTQGKAELQWCYVFNGFRPEAGMGVSSRSFAALIRSRRSHVRIGHPFSRGVLDSARADGRVGGKLRRLLLIIAAGERLAWADGALIAVYGAWTIWKRAQLRGSTLLSRSNSTGADF